MRVLLLGGTTEANRMAQALHAAKIDAVYSYAGRTRHPVRQLIPTRSGGFGGVDGLRAYLASERITHVIDATHPFAAGMSRNAIAACDGPLCALERPAWQIEETWTRVPDIEAAASALPDRAARVFLAIGKQHIGLFADTPHHYLLRLVDPPAEPLPLPRANVIVAKGPFDYATDLALLRDHGIEVIVSKNSGSEGARAKLDAARALNLPVIMIDRPAILARTVFATQAEVMRWLTHSADRGV
ncbi:cobalt-precorrin-6A reductase [Pontivivens nitratireducens]|uniref:Cobalt-precorrin-6A reductase n=1 Tax=Pontivivens nitratireducens TaxID=2758038 RepID=A0A6G7VJL0_9RHOB|nr:cobalt-precorrin-6A reductase [Pontibrevibacter nitratireducens]QIK40211.1 cobalt-precorrin-6A reductase [Pontibrevibacter nitratireducens]